MRPSAKPSSRERLWMRSIAWLIQEGGLGLLYGAEYAGRTDFQLHHVVGRTAKHNKVAIGHWFIIPVPVELHDVSSNHPDNVTHHKKRFIKRFGSQSSIFQNMVSIMDKWNDFDECSYVTPRKDVYDAIMDTRK